jgi:hypothetical protein
MPEPQPGSQIWQTHPTVRLVTNQWPALNLPVAL